MRLSAMTFISSSSLVRGLLYCLFGIGTALAFSGCSKTDDVVKWPALREMDEWAEKAEGWSETGNIAEMRKALPEVLTQAKKLVSSGVPANAHELKEVEQTLADFRDLVQQLEKAQHTDDDLKAQMAAIHPLVEKLMEESGMPHVHEHKNDGKK